MKSAIGIQPSAISHQHWHLAFHFEETGVEFPRLHSEQVQPHLPTMRPKIVSLIAFYHPLIALDGIVALAVLRPVNIGHQATAILAWVSRLAWGYIPFLRGGRAVFLMWMLLSLLASCGLWFLKPWGRILSIILGISWILASIPYFVMGAAFPESYPFDFSSTMRHALQLAVGTLIVIYLCLPKTKLSFHQQNSTAATSRS